jgi:hypothetical protein
VNAAIFDRKGPVVTNKLARAMVFENVGWCILGGLVDLMTSRFFEASGLCVSVVNLWLKSGSSKPEKRTC